MNWKRFTVAASGLAAVALTAGYTAMAAPASAITSPPQLPVTLSACGSGSSAVWNASGDPVLTVGTASAATCGAPAGSTYDPAYAQVVIKVNGHAVPTAEPTFTTDHYASGSPRMVMDLNNGHSLTGYPAASGLNGTDMAWATDLAPNTYTSYAVAYAATNANTTTVKDAYIVEDADQVPGTADTLTGIQFGGAQVQVTSFGPFTMKNVYSGKCLNISDGNYSATGSTNQYDCGATWHGIAAGAQRFERLNFADGSAYLVAISPDSGNSGPWFVHATTKGKALTLTGSPDPYSYGQGGFFGWHGLVADDANFSKSNLTVIWGWPKTGSSNQQWTVTAIG